MSKAQIIDAIFDKISRTMRVAMPAFIESYDFETQKASVQIDIKELYQDNSSIDFPIISEVPVIFPLSGGASFTMPVKTGDSCLVIFMDRDISKWLSGEKGRPPNSRRSHHLNDAIAIMGLKSFNIKSVAKNNTDVLLSYEGSEIILKPEGKIEIKNANEITCNTQSLMINCKNANIKVEELSNIECKNAKIKASETVDIEAKNSNIIVGELASIACDKAQIKATSTIDTETPILTQNGDLKVNGNVEISGTTSIQEKLTTGNGIENSGDNLVSNGKTFETHTHKYQDVTVVVAPDGPCDVTKVPTNSEGPQ